MTGPRPVALPVASRARVGSGTLGAGSGADLQTTPVALPPATAQSRRYLTPARLARLARGLSDRDRSLLATLARVRVATGQQLERLHFVGIGRRQARSALAALNTRRLVARLPRVIGGVRAGSAGFVYTLGVAGQRLIEAGGPRRGQPWSVGTMFLAHSLAVTELFVRLMEAERAGQLHRAEFAGEPSCWRSFAGPGGARVVLKPDASVHLVLGPYEDRWFLEVDRGTESAATLARKCERYRLYWQTGTEQALTGVFPLVLWLVPDDHRYQQVLGVLARGPAEAWPLFAVALFDAAIARLVQGAGA